MSSTENARTHGSMPSGGRLASASSGSAVAARSSSACASHGRSATRPEANLPPSRSPAHAANCARGSRAADRSCPPSPTRCSVFLPACGSACRVPHAAKLRTCSSSALCSSSSRGRSPPLCPSTSASGPAPLPCSAVASACFPLACSTGSLIFDLQTFDSRTFAFQTATGRVVSGLQFIPDLGPRRP